MAWTIKATVDGEERTRQAQSRSEAEGIKADMEDLGLDAEIISPTSADGGEIEAVPDGKPAIADDPIDWVPSHFVDEIQGVPAINRKGYAVLAANQGISVTAEPIKMAHETDFEHAAFKATAVTPDGAEFTGYGSAHVDRQDGDDPYLLNELAETRAMKRATAWATGVGMTAVEEMRGDMEGDAP